MARIVLFHGIMALLIIENDDHLAKDLRQLLLAEGYMTDIANRPIEATSLALHSPYSLIVLDWDLPGTDGLTLLKAWRARGLKTPVLMISEHKLEDEKRQAIEAGADAHLSKPLAHHDLLSTIERVLRLPPPSLANPRA